LSTTSKLIILDKGGSVVASRSGFTSIGNIQWSRDGQRLAFDATRPDGRRGTVVVNSTDLSEVVFLDAGSNPSWGRDSDHVMYVARGHILVINLQTSSAIELMKGNWANWSPDGSAAIIRNESDDLVRVNVRTLRTERVLGTRRIQFGPVWSDDGKYWLFVEADSSWAALLRLNCPEPKRLVVQHLSGHDETIIERLCKSPTILRFDWIYPDRFTP
jgi:Tol biopolymer transport system component